MTLPKTRGVQFEYRCAHLFEEYGYEWDRSGSSLGTDLKILKDGKLKYLVNCKKTAKSKMIYLPLEEVERLSKKSNKRGAQGLICFGFYRTPIYVHTLEDMNEVEQTKNNYKLKKENSKTLKTLLNEGKKCESFTKTSKKTQ